MIARGRRATDVFVWGADLDRAPADVQTLASLLSADEQRRATRFVDEASRRRFVVTRACLRTRLADELGVDARSIRFSAAGNGKPYATEPRAARGIEFNIAHSENRGLFACSFGGPVGVDIERIRPVDGLESAARRHFSTTEIAALEARPRHERTAAFYRCWTRKEAFVKAHGDGLSYPLFDFDVTLDPARANLTIRGDRAAGARWVIQPLDLFDGYAAALVAPSGSQVEILRSVD